MFLFFVLFSHFDEGIHYQLAELLFARMNVFMNPFRCYHASLGIQYEIHEDYPLSIQNQRSKM